MEKIIGFTIGLGIMAMAAQQVSAQTPQNCAPRSAVLERLNENYQETRQSIGLAGPGQVVEVFASTDTGTWTITVTIANGMTCIVASGRSFENLAEALKPSGEGA
ncbi:MAG: hypothetical protein ACU0BB_16565 [Paracoccaceae bacterium]